MCKKKNAELVSEFRILYFLKMMYNASCSGADYQLQSESV